MLPNGLGVFSFYLCENNNKELSSVKNSLNKNRINSFD